MSELELVYHIMDRLLREGSVIKSDFKDVINNPTRVAEVLHELEEGGVLESEMRRRPSGRIAQTFRLTRLGRYYAMATMMQGSTMYGRGELFLEDTRVEAAYDNLRRYFRVSFGDEPEE